MYCSIHEAFQDSAPKPRRKKRPPMPPEPFQLDPDRQAQPPTQVPPVNAPYGGPSYSPPSYQASQAPSQSQSQGTQSPSQYSQSLNAPYTGILDAVETDQSYFLHSTESKDNAYMLEPDWTKQFDGPSVPPWIKERVAAREAEIPLNPPKNGPTSWSQALYQTVPTEYVPPTFAPLPTPAPAVFAPTGPSISDERLLRLEARLDKLFDKLEAVEKSRSESNHIEIILFILGGLFLILMLDLLVKQGTKACILVAKAGGGQLSNLLKGM